MSRLVLVLCKALGLWIRCGNCNDPIDRRKAMAPDIRSVYLRLVNRFYLGPKLRRAVRRLRAQGITTEQLRYLDGLVRADMVEIYGKERVDRFYDGNPGSNMADMR